MVKKPRAKSPPSNDGPSLGPWARLAVTLIAPVAVTLLMRFAPTFVDSSALPRGQRSTGNFGVFALGIMPFISASCLVELAAAIVPRWAPLRHGGPAGRQKLWRATLLCALVLCMYQASDIARLTSFAQEAPGLRATLMIILTLTAGSFLLCFLTLLIGAYGLSGGFGLLMATSPILQGAVSMIETGGAGADGKPLSPLDFAALALLSTAAVAVTWYALRPRAAAAGNEPRERAYRSPPEPEEATTLEIPVPASGTSPLIIAMSLLAFPATLANLRLPMASFITTALHKDTVFSVTALVLIAALSVGLSWVFNQPSRIAALRGGGRATSALEAEARAELFPAMARTLLFCVVIFGIDQLEGELTKHRFPSIALSLALVTAVALDIIGELRARLAMPDLVPVRPEHRPYAVAVARDALRAAGIPVHARDERLRRMLQFFGPFVPIELLVRRADAKQAAKVLAQALSPEGKEKKDERAAVRPRPAARRETRVFAAISLAVMGLLVARSWSRPPPQKPRAHAGASTLQITLVDDDNDVFKDAPGPWPEGVSLQIENVPPGPGRIAPRHYIRIVPTSGESLDEARGRLAAWAERFPVPAGEHVALARISEFDDEHERFEVVGWRTYLLKGPSAVTGADVADAIAGLDTSRDPGTPSRAHVTVKLKAAAAERFAKFTRENAKRRLAIMVDGTVETAPLILSEIPGGYVRITMGDGDPEEQLVEAKQLARALLGEQAP